MAKTQAKEEEYQGVNLFPEEGVSRPSVKKQEEYQGVNLFPEEEEKESWLTRHFINPLKAAKGKTGLETAGNLADLLVNKPIEATGIPNIGHGLFQGAEQVIRGLGNIPADIASLMGKPINPVNFPGTQQQVYPIPESRFPQTQAANPYLSQAGESIGNLFSLAQIAKVQQAAKAGINAVPVVKNMPELLKSILASGTTGAAVSPDNRMLGAGIGGAAELLPATKNAATNVINRYRIAPKQQALSRAENDLMHAQMQQQQLEQEASHQFGNKNPQRLMLTAEDKARELSQGLNFQRNNETPEMQRMLPGEQGVAETKGNLENVNQQLKNILGEGQPHSQILSENVVNRIEGIPTIEAHPKTGLPREVRKGGLREEIGNKWDVLENNLPDIEIPSSVDTNAIEKEMKTLIGSKSNVTEAEKDKLRELLIKTHPGTKSKTINGREFFRAYRSLMREEGNMRSKAFAQGVSPKEHDEWVNRANNVKKTYEDMEGIIKKHFPEDTLKRLYEINHEYSTKVAPLHENPMYQQMLKHGQYSGDIIKSLSGTTKGNPILREMIQNDPELSRLTIGHSFAEKPESLLKKNDLINPYKNANPEIARLMDMQRQGNEAVEKAQAQEPIMQQIVKNRELAEQIAALRKKAKELNRATQEKDISKEEVEKRKQMLEHTNKKIEKAKDTKGAALKKVLSGLVTLAATYGGVKLAQK